jgi:hypothetical protein
LSPAASRASTFQPDVNPAVLGACPRPIAGIGEETIVTARCCVRMLLTITIGIATTLIVSSVIPVVVAPLILMRLVIRPWLILCLHGSSAQQPERDRQRRYGNSIARVRTRHTGLLLHGCATEILYHSAQTSAINDLDRIPSCHGFYSTPFSNLAANAL